MASLLWFDSELTGLREDTDRIIEFAMVVTDNDLNVIDSIGPIVIHQSDDLLNSMNDWCIEHHGKSGLTQAVKDSNITESRASEMMVQFIYKHFPKGGALIAGNTIHADKTFLKIIYPEVHQLLHYRILDVSVIKELTFRRYPSLPKYRKKWGHRALDDILESINELKYYYAHVFKQPSEVNVGEKTDSNSCNF
ncbi:hypothetical protein RCL1_001787 [Eukaryota sp. TZLM3-RCL]